MKKKVAIIGSGISACACAAYLSDKNYKVEIYEKKNEIGGVLRDISLNKKNFLSGPQYFEDSEWLKFFFKNSNLKKLFKKNIINLGSFTDLFDQKPIINTEFAHPVTSKNYNGLIKKKKNTIIDRVNSYQDNISKPLMKWIKNFTNDISEVHFECSKAMQISRVYFRNSSSLILKEKRKNKFSDKLLGVPLQKKYKKFFTPRNGYDLIFNEIFELLKKKGIKFNFNQSIKINKSNALKFFNNKKEIKADFYVWACNPVPLIKATQNHLLDNPAVKISTFFFEVVSPKNIELDKYYQIFSNKTKINRIYIYKLSKRLIINIECFFDQKIKTKDVINKSKEILKKFGYSFSKFEFIGVKKDLRHILFTEGDLRSFLNLYQDPSFRNIIPGFWEEYGREEKISKLFKEIDRRILLK